jgi:uncharacterized protein (DUF488 family)
MGQGGRHLFTVGHGAQSREQLAALLLGARIENLVDVRTAPGSRRHPQFSRKEMEGWVPQAGTSYRWEPGLGGFRRPMPGSPNIVLHHPSFRGYADYMMTEEFTVALRRVLDEAGHKVTAVMCAETLWWRCHRRLVADVATLIYGVSVAHLGPGGRQEAHRVTEGARLDRERGHVIYDAQTTLTLEV